MKKLPPFVDRGIVKAIAWKRTVTGSISILLGIAMAMLGFMRPHVLAFLAAAVFCGTGVWALRDGLRLLRELSRS